MTSTADDPAQSARDEVLDGLRGDGEHLVYLPAGSGAPLVLTGTDDLAEHLDSERERALLPALIDLAAHRVRRALDDRRDQD